MADQEYLVSYGVNGFFGLFRPETPARFDRGSRVVIRGHRGVEVGVVLCPATPGHRQTLDGRSVGTILRTAGDAKLSAPIDAALAYTEAVRIADTLHTSFAVIDVEVLLEPRGLVVHYLGSGGDPRSFVSAFSKRFNAQVELLEAGLGPIDGDTEDAEQGCGLPGCGGGHCGENGGCSSCTSGGCGTKSEPHTDHPVDELVAIHSKLRV